MAACRREGGRGSCLPAAGRFRLPPHAAPAGANRVGSGGYRTETRGRGGAGDSCVICFRRTDPRAVAWQLEAVEAEKAAATAEAARLKVVLDARTASAALAGIQARVAATQAIAQAAEALERLEAEHEVMAASLRDADLERARESELASTQMATHAEALGHVRRALAHARTLASVHAAHHGGVARHRKSAHLAQKLLKEAWWRPSLHTTLQGLQPKVCALPPPAWEPYQLRSTPRAEKLLERACHPGYGILRFSQPVQLR